MSKKLVTIISISILLIGTLFILTGCGKKFDMKKMAGKYELVEMSENDKSYNKEELAKLKEYGITFTLELKEDGTGTIELYGQSSNVKYDENNITIDEDTASYSVDDNYKITIEKDGMKMVFEKQ